MDHILSIEELYRNLKWAETTTKKGFRRDEEN
jgi:hypothetical protein